MKKAIHAAAFAAFMFLPLTVFAAPETATAPKIEKKTFIAVLKEGGWCMYPIGLFSLSLIHI